MRVSHIAAVIAAAGGGGAVTGMSGVRVLFGVYSIGLFAGFIGYAASSSRKTSV